MTDPLLDEMRIIGDRLTALEKEVARLASLPLQRTWVEIEDVLLGAAQATIDFQNIPDIYRHLRIVALLGSSRSANEDFVRLVFNNDTGSVYDWFWFDGRNETSTSTPVFGSNDAIGDPSIEAGAICAANAPSGNYAPLVIEIPHYTETGARRSTLARGGTVRVQAQENIFVSLGKGLWRPSGTTKVSRITLSLAFGPNFVTGSRATLEGQG